MKGKKTMKKTIRLLAMLMTLALLLSMTALITSCIGNGDGEETTGAESTAGSTLGDLEVRDMDGFEILMCWPETHTDGHYVHNELAPVDGGGDVIDSAVASRNAIVEDTYNVKIVVDTKFVSHIPRDYRVEAEAGDSSYHVIASTVKFMTPVALEGSLVDFNKMSAYDETQEWWNHKLMQDFSIANARYFGSGDIIYSDDFYPYCTYVNTAVAASLDSIKDVDFYGMVKDKTWTLEAFHEFAAQVADPEADGDPNTWSEDDMNGAVINANFARAAYYAAGKGMIEFDKKGYPVWQMDVAHTDPIIEKVAKIVHDDGACFYADLHPTNTAHAEVELDLFNKNKTLFLVEELIISERITKRDDAKDFLLLPYPLYDEGSEYISVLNDAAVVSIPVHADRQEDVSLILSAMGRESVNTLTPAFFETVLKYRYMTDPDSVETLQTILDSTVPQDVATISDWGGFMGKFKDMIQANVTTGFSSYYSSNISTAMGKLEEYCVSLDNYYN